MKATRQLALLITSLMLLAGCSSVLRQAPVVDKSPMPPAESKSAATEAPRVDEKGMYTVRKGDTLIRIALDHGLNYRDLAAWNGLANPDDIKVDQVLRVTPPERAAGVTTAPVAAPPSLETKPAVPSTPPVPKKATPRADKKPYSDANLAEMQKADSSPSATEAKPAAPAVAAAVPTPAPSTGTPALSPEDLALSWTWPADGKVVASFDEGKNKGIDIAGKPGQQVLAAGAGKVMYAGSGIRGYGNLVIVKHSNSLLSAYAHNRAIVVKEGDVVTKGQPIAEMGNSDTDSVKLHFEIRQQGKPVDPTKFLPSR